MKTLAESIYDVSIELSSLCRVTFYTWYANGVLWMLALHSATRMMVKMLRKKRQQDDDFYFFFSFLFYFDYLEIAQL